MIKLDRTTSAREEIPREHEAARLTGNFPNPFEESTTIGYDLAEPAFVSIKVFDMLGREVRSLVNEMQPASVHTVDFGAADLPGGLYLYTLRTQRGSQSRIMHLTR